MTKKKKAFSSRPTVMMIDKEIKRLRKAANTRKVVGDVFSAALVIAVVALIVSNMWLPVFQLSGSNMEPALQNGDVVLSVKRTVFKQGETIVFNLDHKILVKRVIAVGGDTVNIAADGTVTVNGTILDEPYVKEKSLGSCDLVFPYTVPVKAYFVMGDDRAASVDSRASVVGSISPEMILGKVILRLWPFHAIGTVK